MDVFLVPVGADRYQLYCELPVDAHAAGDGAPHHRWWARWWKRQMDRFRLLLAQAEEERRRHERGHASQSRGLWRTLLRKIAEVIAEQRLLWHLRLLSDARLIHPDDVTADGALEIAKAEFRRDFERHRRWCIIDALLFLPCTVLTVIPGPNVPALYFSFRALGHFLSLRGARQGLRVVTWTRQPAPALTGIREALGLEARARAARLEAIAATLGLERLAAFVEVERMSAPVT